MKTASIVTSTLATIALGTFATSAHAGTKTVTDPNGGTTTITTPSDGNSSEGSSSSAGSSDDGGGSLRELVHQALRDTGHLPLWGGAGTPGVGLPVPTEFGGE